METEKDVLDIWKERIKKEARHGDRTKACNDTGITMQTYRTAMRREKFPDLKDRELETLQKLIETLDNRKERIAQIQEKYAGQ